MRVFFYLGLSDSQAIAGLVILKLGERIMRSTTRHEAWSRCFPGNGQWSYQSCSWQVQVRGRHQGGLSLASVKIYQLSQSRILYRASSGTLVTLRVLTIWSLALASVQPCLSVPSPDELSHPFPWTLASSPFNKSSTWTYSGWLSRTTSNGTLITEHAQKGQ